MNDVPTPPTLSRPRVLLLDDDQFTLELLDTMLGALGAFEVESQTDARVALATLAERAPDLLICDLVLPGMDGIEFLQAAAERGFAGRVILLSGTDSAVREAAAGLARALGLQVAGAYDKPLRLEQLRQAVQR